MATDYFTCPKNFIINSEEDVLRLFEKQYPHHKLLILQSNLNPDFFDLKTGLAGAILQKLVNYQVQTAFVVDPESGAQEHFREMMAEANTKNEFRFFATKEAATEWLEK